ncbi:MAG: AAA family ATPase [Epulopiscium sp. Nele67-Bin004]|nr:MAG: AAA family ATPase [Epulopiscium sp. Nele67-Bin004]
MQYLNTTEGYNNFLELLQGDIFVDKSMIIEALNKRICTTNKYICITRPRRFGKSEITNLIESYYSKVVASKPQFDNLAISQVEGYNTHLNKHNVIKIDFSELAQENTYKAYIKRVITYLSRDLEHRYSFIDLSKYSTISDKLRATGDKFIFIFDEWDFIFNKGLYINEQEDFLDFLRGLLKGKSYVELCYMTGILPIKKHSAGSALNMFIEYTLLDDGVFENYFGFTEEEVKYLCNKHDMNYSEVEMWYNGYSTESGLQIFNPRSVNIAIGKKSCKSYWVNTGAMDEVAEFLKLNVLGVRDDVIKMINHQEIMIDITEIYRAGAKIPSTREEIYSAMITLGFLTYANGYLRIPNRELMGEFQKALKEDCFGEVATLLKNSDDMLFATINKDAKRVAQIVHDIHNSEIPILKYTDENSTSCVLTLAYLSARNRYRIEREEKSGKGYVDFILHPKNSIDPPIIVELKRNSSTRTAIKQVLEREYIDKYLKNYNRNVLVVAINYSDKKKTHTCTIIEVEHSC